MSKSEGYDVVVMDSEIDNNFMSFHEYKKPDNRFARVDSEIAGEDSDEQTGTSLRISSERHCQMKDACFR